MKRKKLDIKKEPIDLLRLRSIPATGFSWIDRRFVRHGFIESLPSEAILLYFFLVAVSDARGLSFYADPTVLQILKLNQEELTQSRARLIKARLILYQYPRYQVLPLPVIPPEPLAAPPPMAPAAGGGEVASIGDILKSVMAKARVSEA